MTRLNEDGYGLGAIEFGRELTEGLERHEAAEVIEDLMEGILPEGFEIDEKRVKKCATCGYYYRDKTRPNNSVTCSPKCKTLRDTRQRRIKTLEKREQGLIKDVEPTVMQRTYYDHHEYSFWNGDFKYDSENAMEISLSNFEQPYENISEIHAARERYEMMGGRKRHASERAKDYYSGDWD